MKFMILVKATPGSEAGRMPTEALFKGMADYHEALMKAGILVDASGLQRSENAPEGTRVLQFLPSADGKLVTCLWDSDSVAGVRGMGPSSRARGHRFNSISRVVSEPASTLFHKSSREYPFFTANSEVSRVSGSPQSR